MSKYAIPNHYSLRQVYLIWLIAISPKEFADENQLSGEQIFSFRNMSQYTWQDFQEARQS